MMGRIGVIAVAQLLAGVWLAAPAAPQQDARALLERLAQDDPLLQLRQRAGQLRPPAALEGPVDEDAYVVGPGDVFSVTVGGPLGGLWSAEVSADGRLMFAEIGGQPLAGLSLAEARRAVTDRLRSTYANVLIEVALERPRMFYVHVVGAVPQPGRYLVSAVARVEDAVAQAYSKKAYDLEAAQSGGSIAPAQLERILPVPTSERPVLDARYRPSLRTIRVSHRDGASSDVDLLMYYATGRTADNPYLRDGDVVTVSAYHEDYESIRVGGHLPFPGRYPYRPGDTATDLLRVASASEDLSGLAEIRVARRGAAGPETRTLDVREVMAGRADDVEVRPGDRILTGLVEQASASVLGRVRFPGSYPIEEGVTTVTGVLEAAGGVLEDADLDAAYLRRFAPTLVMPEPGASDLDFFGRNYLRESMRETRLTIDVAELLRSDEDFLLEDGDVLAFPRRQAVVFVIGNVPAAGYVPYVEGARARWYIEAAGGSAPLTRGVYVFEPASGRVGTGLDAEVPRGATVFVNREPTTERADLAPLVTAERTSQRQLTLLSRQTVIAGVSAIAALVTTVVAITR